MFRLPGERARSSPLAFGDVTFAVAVLDDYQDVARSFGPWDDLDADAAVARAFEMPVLAWSQNLVADEARALDVEPVGRDELLERADIVTIHLRLSDRTRGLIGAAELALMKRSTVLVNTSRGPIVDEPALIAALRDGTIAGAGLDVYDSEPLPRDHPLRSVPNTVLTPHLGYVTAGTYARYLRGRGRGRRRVPAGGSDPRPRRLNRGERPSPPYGRSPPGISASAPRSVRTSRSRWHTSACLNCAPHR